MPEWDVTKLKELHTKIKSNNPDWDVAQEDFVYSATHDKAAMEQLATSKYMNPEGTPVKVDEFINLYTKKSGNEQASFDKAFEGLPPLEDVPGGPEKKRTVEPKPTSQPFGVSSQLVPAEIERKARVLEEFMGKSQQDPMPINAPTPLIATPGGENVYDIHGEYKELMTSMVFGKAEDAAQPWSKQRKPGVDYPEGLGYRFSTGEDNNGQPINTPSAQGSTSKWGDKEFTSQGLNPFELAAESAIKRQEDVINLTNVASAFNNIPVGAAHDINIDSTEQLLEARANIHEAIEDPKQAEEFFRAGQIPYITKALQSMQLDLTQMTSSDVTEVRSGMKSRGWDDDAFYRAFNIVRGNQMKALAPEIDADVLSKYRILGDDLDDIYYNMGTNLLGGGFSALAQATKNIREAVEQGIDISDPQAFAKLREERSKLGREYMAYRSTVDKAIEPDEEAVFSYETSFLKQHEGDPVGRLKELYLDKAREYHYYDGLYRSMLPMQGSIMKQQEGKELDEFGQPLPYVKGREQNWYSKQKITSLRDNYFKAKGEFMAVTRLYALNQSPLELGEEGGVWNAAKHSMLGGLLKESIYTDLINNGILKGHSTKHDQEIEKALIMGENLPISKDEVEALTASVFENTVEMTGGLLGALPELMLLGWVGGEMAAVSGVTKTMKMLKTGAKIIRPLSGGATQTVAFDAAVDLAEYAVIKTIAPNSSKLAQFALGAAKIGIDEGLWIGAGGMEPGMITGLHMGQKIFPNIPIRNKYMAMFAPIMNGLYKSGLGATVGMEAGSMVALAAQDLMENRDFMKAYKETWTDAEGDLSKDAVYQRLSMIVSNALVFGLVSNYATMGHRAADGQLMHQMGQRREIYKEYEGLSEALNDRGYYKEAKEVRTLLSDMNIQGLKGFTIPEGSDKVQYTSVTEIDALRKAYPETSYYRIDDKIYATREAFISDLGEAAARGRNPQVDFGSDGIAEKAYRSLFKVPLEKGVTSEGIEDVFGKIKDIEQEITDAEPSKKRAELEIETAKLKEQAQKQSGKKVPEESKVSANVGQPNPKGEYYNESGVLYKFVVDKPFGKKEMTMVLEDGAEASVTLTKKGFESLLEKDAIYRNELETAKTKEVEAYEKIKDKAEKMAEASPEEAATAMVEAENMRLEIERKYGKEPVKEETIGEPVRVENSVSGEPIIEPVIPKTEIIEGKIEDPVEKKVIDEQLESMVTGESEALLGAEATKKINALKKPPNKTPKTKYDLASELTQVVIGKDKNPSKAVLSYVENGFTSMRDIIQSLKNLGLEKDIPAMKKAYKQVRDSKALSVSLRNSMDSDPVIDRAEGTERTTPRPKLTVVDEQFIPEVKETVAQGKYDIDEAQRFEVNHILDRFSKGKEFLLVDNDGQTRQILVVAEEYKGPVTIITKDKERLSVEAEALGIDISNFEVETYANLSKGEVSEKTGLVIYEESLGLETPIKAEHTLFSSTTNNLSGEARQKAISEGAMLQVEYALDTPTGNFEIRYPEVPKENSKEHIEITLRESVEKGNAVVVVDDPALREKLPVRDDVEIISSEGNSKINLEGRRLISTGENFSNVLSRVSRKGETPSEIEVILSEDSPYRTEVESIRNSIAEPIGFYKAQGPPKKPPQGTPKKPPQGAGKKNLLEEYVKTDNEGNKRIKARIEGKNKGFRKWYDREGDLKYAFTGGKNLSPEARKAAQRVKDRIIVRSGSSNAALSRFDAASKYIFGDLTSSVLHGSAKEYRGYGNGERIYSPLNSNEMRLLGLVLESRNDVENVKNANEGVIDKQMFKGGLTHEHAEALLDAVMRNDKAALDAVGFKGVDTAKVMEAARRFDKTIRAELDLLHEYKLIADDVYNYLTTYHTKYAPKIFAQHLDAADVQTPDVMGFFAGAPIRKLAGGSKGDTITDPHVMLFSVIHRNQVAKFNNNLLRSMDDFISASPDNGFLTRAVLSKGYFERMNVQAGIRDRIAKDTYGMEYEKLDPDKKKEVYNLSKLDENFEFVEKSYKDAPDYFEEVSFIDKDGERQMMWMDRRYYQDMNTKLKIDDTGMVNLLTGVTFLKAMATGYNPEFAIKNIFRDAAHILLTTEEYSKIMPYATVQLTKDIVEVAKLWKTNPAYKQSMIDAGLGMEWLTTQGALESQLRNIERGNIKKITKGFKKAGTIGKETVGKLPDVGGAMGKASELLTRMALVHRHLKNEAKLNYNLLAQKKFNKSYFWSSKTEKAEIREEWDATWNKDRVLRDNMMTEAVAVARDYLDFSQGGKFIKEHINPYIPYFNAGIQGTRGFARAMVRNPKLFAFKVGQMALLAYAIMNWNKSLWGDEVAEYYEKDVPNYIKEGNFVLMLPFKKTGKDGKDRYPYLPIAKDQSQRLMFGLMEYVVDKTLFNKDATFDKERHLSELGMLTAGIGEIMAPPTVKGGIEYLANYDLFRNKKIWYGEKKGSKERNSKTAAWAADVSDLVENIGMTVSPMRLEQGVSNLTTRGNIYTDILNYAYGNITIGGQRGRSVGERYGIKPDPERKLQRVPFARKVVGYTVPDLDISVEAGKTIEQVNEYSQGHNNIVDLRLEKDIQDGNTTLEHMEAFKAELEGLKIKGIATLEPGEAETLYNRYKQGMEVRLYPSDIKKLKRLPVKARSRVIVDKLEALKPEEREPYIDWLITSKAYNRDVFEHLMFLIQESELELDPEIAGSTEEDSDKWDKMVLRWVGVHAKDIDTKVKKE